MMSNKAGCALAVFTARSILLYGIHAVQKTVGPGILNTRVASTRGMHWYQLFYKVGSQPLEQVKGNLEWTLVIDDNVLRTRHEIKDMLGNKGYKVSKSVCNLPVKVKNRCSCVPFRKVCIIPKDCCVSRCPL